jgi:DNA polymerase I-like protein with 3'-5' exonuclease and polymerase domains
MQSTDKEVAKEILTLLLSQAKLQSMREIYERVRPGEDERIRTELSPVGTDTGRFSSKETFLEKSTNLQNIPKKTAKADPLFDVRSVMVPAGGFVLIEGDLSQAEARATAGYANDTRTLDLFDSGTDIHVRTASIIFSKPVEEITSSERHLGKMARHALNYGMGWKKFLTAVNKDSDLTGVAIDAKTAKGIVSQYRRDNRRLTRWWASVEDDVRTRGYLVNAYGRKRIFLDRSDSSINAAIAYLPQSTIADHLNGILADVFDELDPETLMVLLQIHDAILCQAPIASRMKAACALHRAMDRSIEINGTEVKIPADISISRDSWAQMKEVRV